MMKNEIRVRLSRTRVDNRRPTLGILEVFEGPIVTFRCKTLELPWLKNEKGVSCVPVGEYELEWTKSRKFGATWEIKDVMGRDSIRIHAGNYTREILGCVLVGRDHSDIDNDGKIDVTESANTLKAMERAMESVKTSGSWIEIKAC